MKLARHLYTIVSALVTLQSVAAFAAGADRPVTTPAEQIQFQQAAPFVKFADVYGSRATSAHDKFAIIPANTATPWHTHSAAYHGVVIRGVMINPYPRGSATRMGPGSYWYVPANAVHYTACVSAEPCLFYTHSHAKFDFLPTADPSAK